MGNEPKNYNKVYPYEKAVVVQQDAMFPNMVSETYCSQCGAPIDYAEKRCPVCDAELHYAATAN